VTPSLPSPYDYLDYRRYLADWFEAKKRDNPRFSHRLFARLAGQKSPSLLHHVVEGRRNLTSQTLAGFIKALSLRSGEAQFFERLVQLDQATDTDERNKAWEHIRSTRRFRDARRIEADSFDYLSNWSVPAIRELALRSDFQPTAEWVAEQLRPRIRVPEAKRALDILTQLGFLIPKDGTLVPAEASLTTPTEVSGLAIANYHRGMLERASESIEAFEPTERHLLAVTVSVPDALMPVLKAECNAFLERMMHLCDESTEDADRVMQMNLQLFPLSSRREEPQ
jgi:uncharacterized protein (TIGR02147 family)